MNKINPPAELILPGAMQNFSEILHNDRKPYKVTFEGGVSGEIYSTKQPCVMMTSECRVVNVPIKPHLKKFLLKNFDLPEPFRLDEHTSVGKNLLKALKYRQEAANLSERQTDTIAIELSSRAAKMSPGISQLVYINTLLDEMFQEGLILWIFAQSYAGVNPHNSCKSFLFFFNIDENEYTYDAAHKAWLRYRSVRKDRMKKIARKGPKIFPKMSE